MSEGLWRDVNQKMIKKRTRYCEPEKNVTAKGNSKQNNETKTMKQTPCIRGQYGKNVIWPGTVLWHIFSHLFFPISMKQTVLLPLFYR